MQLFGAFIFLLLVACGGNAAGGDDTVPDANEACPANLERGDSCSFSGRCWKENDFSTCMSEWCTCENGVVSCEGFYPSTGKACGDTPIDFCSYEGTPSCTTPPTSSACGCNADGTWHCRCLCYGASSTCGTCPTGLSLAEIEGAGCETVGTECPYTEGTCRCVNDNGLGPRFHCE